MQRTPKTSILTVKDGWITCPNCRRNKRFFRIDQDTEAHRLPVYCYDCKHESVLDITRGQRVELRSP